MFTKNLKYRNDEIKNKYKMICKDKDYLSLIIENLAKEYPDFIINDILFNEEEITLDALAFHDKITILSDLKKRTTTISSSSWSYSVVYDNIAKNILIPKGYLYINDGKRVFKKDIMRLNTSYSKYNSYDYVINNKLYEISLNEINDKFDENKFIDYLLQCEDKIENIRDLLKYINNDVDLSKYEIKLKEDNNYIILYKGYLTKYIEYLEKDNCIMKIYLENNKFYMEKTTKEEVEDRIPFVKRIGDYDGKR